jgi:hypothetical protein
LKELQDTTADSQLPPQNCDLHGRNYNFRRRIATYMERITTSAADLQLTRKELQLQKQKRKIQPKNAEIMACMGIADIPKKMKNTTIFRRDLIYQIHSPSIHFHPRMGASLCAQNTVLLDIFFSLRYITSEN